MPSTFRFVTCLHVAVILPLPTAEGLFVHSGAAQTGDLELRPVAATSREQRTAAGAAEGQAPRQLVSEVITLPRVSGTSPKRGSFRVALKRQPHQASHNFSHLPRSLLQLGVTATSKGLGASLDGGKSSLGGPPPDKIFGTVYVGTPPKEFSVAFDTISGNLMLPSVKCHSMPCISHRSYDAFKSATSARISTPWWIVRLGGLPMNLMVSTGQVSGSLLQDKVCLGSEDNLCSKLGLVEALQMTDEPFSLFPFDGILGLGLTNSSLGQQFNFMGVLADHEALASNKFAVWFATEADSEDSEITFGVVSDARQESEVLWLPVEQPSGLWQVKMDDVTVNMVKTKFCGSGGCKAAFDTAGGVIAGPPALINALVLVLNVQPDCSNYDKLPRLGFSMGPATFNVEGSDYVRKTGDGCFLQMMAYTPPPGKEPLVLLGTPFLRRYYTIYDTEALQVGVALAKHAPSTTESTKPPGKDAKPPGKNAKPPGKDTNPSDDDAKQLLVLKEKRSTDFVQKTASKKDAGPFGATSDASAGASEQDGDAAGADESASVRAVTAVPWLLVCIIMLS